MDNKSSTPILQNRLFSQRITADYVISNLGNYSLSDSVEIIKSAYSKTIELFNPDSDNSIVNKTLSFYMDNIDSILTELTAGKDSLRAVSMLLPAFIKIQALIYEGSDSLKQKLSSELITNRDYYTLFDLDYYIELSRISGVDTALKELEEDVNIRANTYYGTAYKEYLDILPGFDNLFSLPADS